MLLDQCADEIEVLTAEQMGEGVVVQRVRDRIDAIFGPRESAPEMIVASKLVSKMIDEIKPISNTRRGCASDHRLVIEPLYPHAGRST